MSNLTRLEQQVAALSTEELAAFRAWFAEFDEEQWDRQLEADAENGKLERMAESALRAYDEGRTKPL